MYVLQTYSVRRVEVGEKRSVYVTVAFAGVALMVAMLIGVVVIRRRSSRYPQHQVLPPPGLCTLCNVHTVTPPSTSSLTQHHSTAQTRLVKRLNWKSNSSFVPSQKYLQ